MPPRELWAQCDRVIHKLRAFYILWRDTSLHPLHHRSQHVPLFLKRHPGCSCTTALPDDPRSRPRIAMSHPRDTKITPPTVHVFVATLSAQMIVEAVCVECSNLVILLAVVYEQPTSTLFESGERRRIGAYVSRVQRFCCTCVGEGVSRSVP